MISRNEKLTKGSLARRVFKAIYNYLFPLIFLSTIVFGVLSFFEDEIPSLGSSQGMSFLAVEGEYGVYDTSGIENLYTPVYTPVYYTMLNSVNEGDMVLSSTLHTESFTVGDVSSLGFVVRDNNDDRYYFGVRFDGNDNYFRYYAPYYGEEEKPLWGVEGLEANQLIDYYLYGEEKVNYGLSLTSDNTVIGSLTFVYQSETFSLYQGDNLVKSWKMIITNPEKAEQLGITKFLVNETGISIMEASIRHYLYVKDFSYLLGSEATNWTLGYKRLSVHKVMLITFICLVVLTTALYTLDKVFTNRDNSYRLFGVALNRKFNMSNFVTIITIAVITLIPFYILTITSLKHQVEADGTTFSWFPAQGITFENFAKVFTDTDSLGMNLFRAMGNSFIYAIIPTLIGLFVSALSAYAFAKLKFKGKEVLFRVLLFTMMIPGCITMASAFVMFDTIGWTGRAVLALPLLIPGCFGGVATMLFLKEFFSGIPDSLLEAAKIDGYGKVKSFFKIILPLGGPALIAQFVLGFISGYNNYTAALIYLSDPSQYTIPLAISIFSSSHGVSRALYSSAGVMALVPTLLLYIVFQKQILQGINLSSGLKG